jgi:hypothetical protein
VDPRTHGNNILVEEEHKDLLLLPIDPRRRVAMGRDERGSREWQDDRMSYNVELGQDEETGVGGLTSGSLVALQYLIRL